MAELAASAGGLRARGPRAARQQLVDASHGALRRPAARPECVAQPGAWGASGSQEARPVHGLWRFEEATVNEVGGPATRAAERGCRAYVTAAARSEQEPRPGSWVVTGSHG